VNLTQGLVQVVVGISPLQVPKKSILILEERDGPPSPDWGTRNESALTGFAFCKCSRNTNLSFNPLCFPTQVLKKNMYTMETGEPSTFGRERMSDERVSRAKL
jgi:hypothetical protein